MSGTQRLLNLLELAAQGPAMRAALAEEVAGLLMDWPEDCPADMRLPCEALLARAAQEVDEDAKLRLRVLLYTDPKLAARILPREPKDRDVLDVIRAGEDVAPHMARALGISESIARDILADPSARSLAVAARILGLDRAGFSSLALLSQAPAEPAASQSRLEAWEGISVTEARHQLRRWSAA